MAAWLRLTLLGVGAMNSPRYHPAGLPLAWRRRQVMFDGGGDAAPESDVDAWLVTDEQAELMPAIRFPGGVGGHASVRDTAERARRRPVRRLVFAHIGRPSIRAQEAGERPPYGEWGVEGRTYRLAAG